MRVASPRLVWKIALGIAAGLAWSAPAAAEVIHFRAELSQDWHEMFLLFPEEGTGSSATGTMTFSYNTETTVAGDIELHVSGLSVADLQASPVEQAHIHIATGGLRVLNVGVLGFSDEPGGFGLSGAQSPITSALEVFLIAGQTWLNIHTQAFPNGEIAGVVQPVVAAMPGLGGVGGAMLTALLVALGRASVHASESSASTR